MPNRWIPLAASLCAASLAAGQGQRQGLNLQRTAAPRPSP